MWGFLSRRWFSSVYFFFAYLSSVLNAKVGGTMTIVTRLYYYVVCVDLYSFCHVRETPLSNTLHLNFGGFNKSQRSMKTRVGLLGSNSTSDVSSPCLLLYSEIYVIYVKCILIRKLFKTLVCLCLLRPNVKVSPFNF